MLSGGFLSALLDMTVTSVFSQEVGTINFPCPGKFMSGSLEIIVTVGFQWYILISIIPNLT